MLNPNWNKLKKAVLLCIATVVVTACNTNDGDILGAEVFIPSDAFEVTTPFQLNTDQVNFENSEVVTSIATFNERVTGDVTFTGLTSGATHSYGFTANELDASTFQWRGGHNNNTFFVTGETVVAELSFLSSNIKFFDTVVVDQEFLFSTDEIIHSEVGNPGPEDPTNISAGNFFWFFANNNNFDPEQSFFVQLDSTGSEDGVDALQGSRYVRMQGVRPVGQFITSASAGARTDGVFYWDLPEDPNNVWVNVYAYGNGLDDPGTDFIIALLEADGGPGADDNATGGEDDQYNFFVTFNHIGWKLFSIRYADLPIGTFLANGNGIREPNRLKVLSYNLQSQGPIGETAVARFEMPMFTIGGPFDPSKF